MKTSGTNRRLRLLLTGIKDGTLIPRPEFQRRLVWTNKDKQDFVQTVLMEYPFPEIYIAAGDIDPDTGVGTELLVDGQQRITTLYQYFVGSPDLRLGALRPYARLTPEEKVRFLEYEVVVRDLGQKSIEEIKEVFKRINSTKYSLNAMEVHNARFDGAFKRFGEELSEDRFFEDNNVFKTNDVRRMGDLVFCLTLAITVMTTYFNRDDELEDFLEKYNDEFPEQGHILSQLRDVFGIVTSFQLDPKSRAWRKAELLNLLVEVDRVHLKERQPCNAQITGANLAEFYGRVDQVGAGNTDVDEVTTYYKAAIQATNDRSNRIKRGQVISGILRDGLTF